MLEMIQAILLNSGVLNERQYSENNWQQVSEEVEQQYI